MFGRRRMPDTVLADLLGRLAIALAAGIDIRRAWHSEAERVPSVWRPAMRRVAEGLRAGGELPAALDAAGDVFPPLVRGMIRVGERTGHLPAALRDTAQEVAEGMRLRRELLAGLAGPAIRLGAAVVAVGALILVSGTIRGLDGLPVDLVGLGLSGWRGLSAFAIAVAVVGACGMAAVWSGWARGVARACASRLPLIGAASRAAEAAAWCRAAALAAHVGTPVGELVALASSAAPGLAIDPAAVESRLRQGDDLATALAAARRLPREVLEAVAVGEVTGSTAECLDRAAERLAADSRRGFSRAVQLAGFAAWAGVACLVAAIVIRVMTAYAAMIQEAGRLR